MCYPLSDAWGTSGDGDKRMAFSGDVSESVIPSRGIESDILLETEDEEFVESSNFRFKKQKIVEKENSTHLPESTQVLKYLSPPHRAV